MLVDLSRNRSKRYCDSRTCGNRLHVAAYRARQRTWLPMSDAGRMPDAPGERLPSWSRWPVRGSTDPAYAYLAGGSGDEHTLRWNIDGVGRGSRWRRTFLVDVGAIDTRLHLLGHDLAAPILLAPHRRHRLFHPDGEVETVRGAAAAERPRASCPRSPRSACHGGRRRRDRAVVVPALRPARPGLHP